MIQTLLVFIGGGIGAAGRHGVNIAAARLFGSGFPAGTMIVNLAGCFLMGIVAGWFAMRAGENLPQHLRLFLATGILGGFTTFSAFSLDAALLWERGETGAAAFYVLGSVVLSIGALFAGLALMRAVS